MASFEVLRQMDDDRLYLPGDVRELSDLGPRTSRLLALWSRFDAIRRWRAFSSSSRRAI